MKTMIMFAVLLFYQMSSIYSQPIGFDGNVGYEIDFADETLTFQVDRIENNNDGGRSGTLVLKLYFSEEYYSGDDLSAYPAGSYRLTDVLAGGEYFYDIDRTVEFTCPPDGYYYPVIALLEWKGDDYYIIDYSTYEQVEIGTNADGTRGVVND